jgi:hypothetical protein
MLDDDWIVDPETRRGIFDHLKDAPERQLADNNDVDTKAATLFGAASVVLGLVSFGSLGATLTGGQAVAVTLLLVAAGVAFLLVAVAAAIELWPVDQRRSVFAATLREDFRNKPIDEFQEWIIRQARLAWEYNAGVGSRKGAALEWIVGGLAAEVLLVVAALVVARA